MPSPREYLHPPAAFGRVDRVTFYLPTGHSLPELLGAVVQHYVALRAREFMVLRQLDPAAVGRQAGLAPRTVENVLGGQTAMSLQLAGALVALGGPDAWPHPESVHRLLQRAGQEYARLTCGTSR